MKRSKEIGIEYEQKNGKRNVIKGINIMLAMLVLTAFASSAAATLVYIGDMYPGYDLKLTETYAVNMPYSATVESGEVLYGIGEGMRKEIKEINAFVEVVKVNDDSAEITVDPIFGPPAPSCKDIVVSSDPTEANAKSSGSDLGTTPVTIAICEGTFKIVSLSKDGYEPKSTGISYEKEDILVKLDPIATPEPTPVPTPEPTPVPTPVPTPEPTPEPILDLSINVIVVKNNSSTGYDKYNGSIMYLNQTKYILNMYNNNSYYTFPVTSLGLMNKLGIMTVTETGNISYRFGYNVEINNSERWYLDHERTSLGGKNYIYNKSSDLNGNKIVLEKIRYSDYGENLIGEVIFDHTSIISFLVNSFIGAFYETQEKGEEFAKTEIPYVNMTIAEAMIGMEMVPVPIGGSFSTGKIIAEKTAGGVFSYKFPVKIDLKAIGKLLSAEVPIKNLGAAHNTELDKAWTAYVLATGSEVRPAGQKVANLLIKEFGVPKNVRAVKFVEGEIPRNTHLVAMEEVVIEINDPLWLPWGFNNPSGIKALMIQVDRYNFGTLQQARATIARAVRNAKDLNKDVPLSHAIFNIRGYQAEASSNIEQALVLNTPEAKASATFSYLRANDWVNMLDRTSTDPAMIEYIKSADDVNTALYNKLITIKGVEKKQENQNQN